MRLIPALLGLALLVADASRLAAQGSPRFRSLGPADGLSQATVTAIAQDSLGFLWFGTQDGLNRYDGYEVEVMRDDGGTDDRSVAGHLPNSSVSALLVDRDGTLWVGTYGGLSRYDWSSGRFETLAGAEFEGVDGGSGGDDPASRYGAAVRSLLEAEDGTLWIGTSRGLARRPPEGPVTAVWGGSSTDRHDIRSLAEGPGGEVWIGSSEGLHILDPGSGAVRPLVVGGETLLTAPRVWALLRDESGAVWVGTDEAGLLRVSPDRGTVDRWRSGPGEPAPLLSDDIRALHQDGDGRIWIGTFDGLNRLDPATGELEGWQARPGDAGSLAQNSIASILSDREGLVWIGTMTAGLSVYDPLAASFAHLREDRADSAGLRDGIVYEVHRSDDGALWVGTREGGLHRYRPETDDFDHWGHDPTDPGSLASNYVVAVDDGPDGSLWVATYQSGLDRLDPETGTIRHYRHDPSDSVSLASDRLRDVLVDRDGDVWIATSGAGLDRLDPETGRFTHHRSEPNDPRTLSGDFVRSLFLDRDDRLWVGTYGAGANLHHRDTGTFTRFLPEPGDAGSLGSRFVRSIRQSADGALWFATDDGVSVLPDPSSTGPFRRYDGADGLPPGVIYGVLEDQRGRLWMSSNDGLARMEPSSGEVVVFDEDDGLQADEFNTGAFFRGEDGRMYFGGVGGLTVFHPDSVRRNAVPPPVRVTDVRVFNESLSVSDTSGLARHPAVATSLTLAPDDDFLSVHFTALSYRNPPQNRFRYRLLGFDDRWIGASAQEREAAFTDLPAGDYTLEVQGANDDGVWGTSPRTLELEVRPAFWETIWFQGLLLLLAAGVLAGGVSWRHRALRTRTLALERRVEKRTRALRENVAELETSLLHIKRLEGLLPICSGCKKIRVDGPDDGSGGGGDEEWVGVTTYIRDRTDADFSHGICPECAESLYPDYAGSEGDP